MMLHGYGETIPRWRLAHKSRSRLIQEAAHRTQHADRPTWLLLHLVLALLLKLTASLGGCRGLRGSLLALRHHVPNGHFGHRERDRVVLVGPHDVTEVAALLLLVVVQGRSSYPPLLDPLFLRLLLSIKKSELWLGRIFSIHQRPLLGCILLAQYGGFFYQCLAGENRPVENGDAGRLKMSE